MQVHHPSACTFIHLLLQHHKCNEASGEEYVFQRSRGPDDKPMLLRMVTELVIPPNVAILTSACADILHERSFGLSSAK